MSSLDDKTALVTGGARGIGRRYALRLAKAGADVAVADLDLKSFAEYETEAARITAETVTEEIEAEGVAAMGSEVDVTDPKAVTEFVANVVEEFGSFDIVVANAGGGDSPMADIYASTLVPEYLQATVERNLHGTVYTCIAAVPYLKAQELGRIITVASQASRVVLDSGTHAHYGAAKAAVIMYTKYLASDLAPHDITVNAVAPGYIDTGKLRSNIDDEDAIKDDIPLGRFGDPDDCADAVEFLAGPETDYITGAVIPIDGGSAEL